MIIDNEKAIKNLDDIINYHYENTTIKFSLRMKTKLAIMNLQKELRMKPMDEEKVYSNLFDVEEIGELFKAEGKQATYLDDIRPIVDRIADNVI